MQRQRQVLSGSTGLHNREEGGGFIIALARTRSIDKACEIKLPKPNYARGAESHSEINRSSASLFHIGIVVPVVKGEI